MIGKSSVLVCGAFVLLIPMVASADWYSGDPYAATTAWPQYTDNLSDANQILALTYDNFTWPSGAAAIDRVGGHFFSFDAHDGSTYDTAYWEIRTGMAHNVAGTLVNSGSGAVTWSPTAFTQGGYDVWSTDVDVPDFSLPAGNYWFGLAIGTSTGTPQSAYVTSTTGTNGIGGPLGDDYSIYFQSINSVVSSWNYVDGQTVVGTESAGLDPSYWILEVPEPTTLTLASLIGALIACRGRLRGHRWN